MAVSLVGERIRVLRDERLGWTQAELAEVLQVKRDGTISDWETGTTTPEPRSLVPIALLFHDAARALAYLLGDARIDATGLTPRFTEPVEVTEIAGDRRPSDRDGPDLVSGPVRVSSDVLHQLGVIVPALDRMIAESVKQTIARNEIGYSQATRDALADSLELFANDLEARCGYNICADIWKVVSWLRKTPPKKP